MTKGELRKTFAQEVALRTGEPGKEGERRIQGKRIGCAFGTSRPTVGLNSLSREKKSFGRSSNQKDYEEKTFRVRGKEKSLVEEEPIHLSRSTSKRWGEGGVVGWVGGGGGVGNYGYKSDGTSHLRK